MVFLITTFIPPVKSGISDDREGVLLSVDSMYTQYIICIYLCMKSSFTSTLDSSRAAKAAELTVDRHKRRGRGEGEVRGEGSVTYTVPYSGCMDVFDAV